MFKLEEQIHLWRKTLVEVVGDQPEVVDELESHLREEVERLLQSGASPEQAWTIAVGRLGEPADLAQEFAKLRRPSWLPARVAYGAMIAGGLLLAWFMVAKLGHGTFQPLLTMHIYCVTAGYAGGFTVGTLAAWAILSRALFGWDAQRDEALRSASSRLAGLSAVLTCTGVVLGACWARQNWGRYWGWDLKEIGGLSVLAWASLVAWCLHRRWISGMAAMLTAITGNIVVSLSWFGPGIAGAGLRAYGFGPTYGVLLGFIACQLVVASAGLLPPGGFNRKQNA
ncbi:MAG: cytochrome c biogenesis protein CcsA [Tepidisphaerales bacterium]